MKMVFRWFPEGDDSVSLAEIRQIPGVSGVAACMPSIPVGEVWPLDRLIRLRDEVSSAGLEMEVIESVNIHEDIKKGLPTRDRYIQSYIDTMRNLNKVGVKCICYNFMPVMDWLRSNIAFALEDGSTVLSYEHEKVLKMDPFSINDALNRDGCGFSLPGWEPERMPFMAKDIQFYQRVSAEEYMSNMKYFLDAVIPYAEEFDIDMAIHPDDPPWQLFGLPKLITDAENIREFLGLNTSRRNGLTLCIGSLASRKENDVAAMAAEFGAMGRVPFAHLRNIHHTGGLDFHETAHPSCCGDTDMFEVVKALFDSGFDGYIRPDHGRMIWGEKGRPGYGLYDRAGSMLSAGTVGSCGEAVRQKMILLK